MAKRPQNGTEMLASIMEYLRTQPNCAFVCTDAPYERFAAEVQDWSAMTPGCELLILGYWFERYGDQVPDPNIIITFTKGVVTDMQVQTCMGVSLHPTAEYQIYDVFRQINEMYDRHLVARLEHPAQEAGKKES